MDQSKLQHDAQRALVPPSRASSTIPSSSTESESSGVEATSNVRQAHLTLAPQNTHSASIVDDSPTPRRKPRAKPDTKHLETPTRLRTRIKLTTHANPNIVDTKTRQEQKLLEAGTVGGTVDIAPSSDNSRLENAQMQVPLSIPSNDATTSQDVGPPNDPPPNHLPPDHPPSIRYDTYPPRSRSQSIAQSRLPSPFLYPLQHPGDQASLRELPPVGHTQRFLYQSDMSQLQYEARYLPGPEGPQMAYGPHYHSAVYRGLGPPFQPLPSEGSVMHHPYREFSLDRTAKLVPTRGQTPRNASHASSDHASESSLPVRSSLPCELRPPPEPMPSATSVPAHHAPSVGLGSPRESVPSVTLIPAHHAPSAEPCSPRDPGSPREPLASLEHLSRLASHDHHPLQHLVSHNPMQTPPSRRVSVVPNVIPPQTLPSPNGSELSYAIRHATHSPENATQVHEQQYDAPTSKKGDDQQAQDPDEDIVIGPGRISDANHLILEGGFSVIQDKVIEMATQTGLPPTQILRLWMKKFGRIRPQQNMWNIYEKYFTANRDLEEARDLTDLDGYNDDMDKDSSQFRRLCYESFKREHEDSWREVLEAFQVTKDLSTVTTVGGRQRTFLSAYKHVHTILEMYQKREGFESIWGFVGKNVNSDTSLCRIYESKGAENFFSVRFRAHEHIVKSQLKAHVYNTSSLEVAQQIYDDDETKGSKKDNITESHDDGKSSDDVEEPPAGSRIPYIKSEFIKRAAKVGGTISVTQFPWKTMPKVFSVQGIQCINYPEDARLPGELTSGDAKSKGIADLTRKEEEALVEALRGNPPLTFVSVPDERKKALTSSRYPVLIGAAPRAGSRHSRARQMFANGKTDRLGPARVTASDSDDDESEKENAVRPRTKKTSNYQPPSARLRSSEIDDSGAEEDQLFSSDAPVPTSSPPPIEPRRTRSRTKTSGPSRTRQFEAVVIPTRTPQSGTKPATNSVIEISSGSGSEYQPESESDPFVSPVKKASSRPIDELQKTFERNVDMLAADSDSSIEFISGSKAKHDKKIELPVKVDKGKKRLQSESEGEDADETMLKKGKKKARVQHTELRHAASEVEKPKKRSRPEAQSDDADEGKVKKEKKKARVQHTDVRVAPSEATLPTVCAPRPKPRPTYRGAINKGKGANISHVDEPQTVPADIADIPTEASTDEAPSVQAAGMNNHSDGRSRVGAPADEQDPALVAMYSPGRYDEWDQHAAHDIRPLPPHNTRPLPSRDSRGLALRDVRPLSAHDPRVLPPDTRAPYPHDAQPLPPHEARRLPLYDAPRLPAHDPRVLPPNTRAPHAHDAQPLPPHEARRLPLYDAPLLPPHDLRALAHDARPLLPQDARGLSPYDPRVLHSQPQSRYHSQAMPYHAQPYYPPEYGPWYDTLDGRRTADGMMGHYPEPGPSDHRYQEQYGAGQPDPGYPRRLPAQYPPGYPRERYAEDGGASGYGQEDEPPK